MINIKMTLVEAKQVFDESTCFSQHEYKAIVTYGGDHYVESALVQGGDVEICTLGSAIEDSYETEVKVTIIPEEGK